MADGAVSTKTTADAVEGDSSLIVSVRSIMTVVWITIAALATMHLTTQAAAAAGVIRDDGRIASVFNMDVESSIPTWFSMLLLATIAFAQIGIFAVLRVRGSSPRVVWLVLGIAFLLVSLDEGAALHEHLTTIVRSVLGVTSGPLYYAWIVPYVIVLIAVAPLLVGFFRRLPRRILGLMLLAAGLYLGGAVGVEMISGFLTGEARASDADGSHLMWLLNAAEETLELSGAATFGYAVLTYYRTAVQSSEGLRLIVVAQS